MIVSMDDIFGLPRNKEAGEGVWQPLHGHPFFDEHTQVDEYVISTAKVSSYKVKPLSQWYLPDCMLYYAGL